MTLIKILIALIASIGILLIFDARPIVRRFFTSADRNIATKFVKITGLLLLLFSMFLFSINLY